MLLASALAASWCAIEWSPEGSDDFPGGVVLRDAAGEILRVSLGPGDVDCRPFYAASADDWIVKALIAAEDGSFWTHPGVRPLSALRALCQNVFSRRRISGASTITMQTVRLIRPHRKGYAQKWVEAFRALKMERRRDKLWILSQYLNRAPFGSNFIGIEAAANGWFGKGAKDLGLGEAALLAGMVQAPSRFRPDRGLDAALKRRDYVLARMQALGLATAEQVEGAKGVVPALCRAPRPFRAPYYCDWYLRDVLGRDRAADRLCGAFTTPLDPDVQRLCEAAVAGTDARGLSAAVVVLRVATGDVVALACSGDYFGPEGSQVNTARAPRPAGSTLKPFLAAQALALGVIGPDATLLDAPLAVKGYRPSNFDGQFRGRVSLKDALVLSLNLPFVRLLQEVGVDRFAEHLRALGFRHVRADGVYGLGLAIGNAEVTLVELVTAYRELARRDAVGGTARPIPPTAAAVLTDFLSGEERSAAALGHVAAVAAPRFAWKTGTSAAYRDAWTVMWNPEYVIGVWRGHLTGGFGDRRLVGAQAAAPLAWQVARALYPADEGPWYGEREEREELRVENGELRVSSSTFNSPLSTLNSQLSLAVPEDGARFVLVPNLPQQKIVCKVIGNPDGRRLWWFVDGAPVGESVGSQPFPVEMTAGTHVITCARLDGETAEATVEATR